MRGLVQRVVEESVTVGGEVVGAIGPGLCLLVGVTHTDTPATAAALAVKVFHLRVLDGGPGRPERSLADIPEPAVLVVSQFTLYADTSRGRRPSWLAAAPGAVAQPLVGAVAERLAALGCTVATGRFGASMLVALVGDGPITVLLEVSEASEPARSERRLSGPRSGGAEPSGRGGGARREDRRRASDDARRETQ